MSKRLTVTGEIPGSATHRLVHLCLILGVVSAVVVGLGRLMNAPELLLFTAEFVFLLAALGGSVVFLARRRLGEARTMEWVKNLALLFATLAVMTVSAEFGMRVLFAGITTTGDNSSYWARRWNATHVHLNHLGFREREFPAQRPSGVYRIAVVGDSFTLGQGIDEGDRFTNRLDRELNRRGQPFEVLNFGRPGAETIDEVQMLKDVVVGVQPDFILLQWYINDVEGHDKSGRPEGLPLIPSETLDPLLHRHSALYYVLMNSWGQLQEGLGWTGRYEDYMHARFGDPESAASREAAAALSELIALCREQNIALGIVLFPDMSQIISPVYPFDFLHERVLAHCSREGLDCLDLRAPMAEGGRRVRLNVNRFDGHPNAKANRIAAEEILKRFEPIWNQAAAGRHGRA